MISHSIAALSFVGLVFSHSWVERLMLIDPNGTMIGEPGYIRGAVSRWSSAFNDFQVQHQLPTTTTTNGPFLDRICKETQRVRNYTVSLPALQAFPGSFIALQYQENGHVTLPELTPQKRDSGTIYIYGTLDPRDDDLLTSIHNVWNQEGTGGDSRGKLLAIRKFDDQQCYQINNGTISMTRQERFRKAAMNPQGADLWCQSDIRLPYNIPYPGWYTLYWVWDWPSGPDDDSTLWAPEIYTSCMDVEMQSDAIELNEIRFIDGQDLNLAGIRAQLEA